VAISSFLRWAVWTVPELVFEKEKLKPDSNPCCPILGKDAAFHKVGLRSHCLTGFLFIGYDEVIVPGPVGVFEILKADLPEKLLDLFLRET
jgi:hypothetical protein